MLIREKGFDGRASAVTRQSSHTARPRKGCAKRKVGDSRKLAAAISSGQKCWINHKSYGKEKKIKEVLGGPRRNLESARILGRRGGRGSQ